MERPPNLTWLTRGKTRRERKARKPSQVSSCALRMVCELYHPCWRLTQPHPAPPLPTPPNQLPTCSLAAESQTQPLYLAIQSQVTAIVGALPTESQDWWLRWNHRPLPLGKSYWTPAGHFPIRTASSSSRPMRWVADSHPGRVRASAGLDLVCTHSSTWKLPMAAGQRDVQALMGDRWD